MPALLSLPALVLLAAAPAAPASFVHHPLRLDDHGLILSWLPQDRAYDGVVRRAWGFLATKAPKTATGLPQYAVSCCLDTKNDAFAWPHNPAGVNAMLTESALAYYAYAADRTGLDLVRPLLDHHLANGTTPKGWDWAQVPYASSDHGSRLYRGASDFKYDAKLPARGDGYGVIEPDKVGELGLAYLRFWQATGKTVYRDAALACANALAKHVRAGDDAHSPWPFRVIAETGVVREEYSASVQGPLRLLDELVRLKVGDVESFRRARETAFRWLVEHPLKNEVWANYFEDISFKSDTKNSANINPIETARYLMEPGRDPEWRTHVPALLAYAEKTFGADAEEGKRKEAGVQWGAIAISEQLAYRFKMGSHTSRFASVTARWAELSGDAAAREKAFRSFNWASYMCQEDGVVVTGPNEPSVWYTDGYGDYIRHFLAGMASVPAWAPPGEDHLLRSSSVVTAVDYRPRRVTYKTFDAGAEDVLRLSFSPTKVTVDGKPLRKTDDADAPDTFVASPLPGGDVVVKIHRTRGRAVVIEGAPQS